MAGVAVARRAEGKDAGERDGELGDAAARDRNFESQLLQNLEHGARSFHIQLSHLASARSHAITCSNRLFHFAYDKYSPSSPTVYSQANRQ